MKTTINYKGTTTIISDNLFEHTQIIKKKPVKNAKFKDSLYYDGVYYFPNDIRDSTVREGKPFEIQGVFYSGKWYQDTFYIDAELKELLTNG